MSYPPQQPYQPPVVPSGAPAYEPPPQADWAPPKPSRGPLPWLIGALVVAVLVVGGVLAVYLGGVGQKPSAPAASLAPALTQAGAERACRTAFSKEFDARQDQNIKKDNSVIVSVQGIDLAETWQEGAGYAVNGTVRFTLTAWPVDPVESTLDLTCKVTGTDERPVTFVDNRN